MVLEGGDRLDLFGILKTETVDVEAAVITLAQEIDFFPIGA